MPAPQGKDVLISWTFLAHATLPFDDIVYSHRDHRLREGDGALLHVRMLIQRWEMQNLPADPRPATPE
jgi:hypothetical protein